MNEEEVNETPEKTEAPKADDKEIEEGKTFAGIGYLGILFLVPLLAAKDNKFAKFHGKQGVVLTTGTIIAFVALWVMWFMFFFILVVGWAICLILWAAVMVMCIGWLVFAIMGFVKALQGEYWKMPLFGGLAEKINI